jgi:Spy/CpxP family protein refolding chaperone
MSRIRSAWLVTLILGSTLVAAGAAGADTQTPGTPGAHVNRMQQALGLTDDQMNAIRQVHAQQAGQQKQVRQSLHQSQAELRQLALAGGDPAAIQAKAGEVTQLLSQSVALRVQSLQAIAPILTPDQRAKLAQLAAVGGGHHGGHRYRQQSS